MRFVYMEHQKTIIIYRIVMRNPRYDPYFLIFFRPASVEIKRGHHASAKGFGASHQSKKLA